MGIWDLDLETCAGRQLADPDPKAINPKSYPKGGFWLHEDARATKCRGHDAHDAGDAWPFRSPDEAQ